MTDLERFTVSLDGRLLGNFDERNHRKGYANRSEAIRDLIRQCLVQEEWDSGAGNVAATLTLVYDHHKRELKDRLHDLQHHHGNMVVATTHVHLDPDNCLEVVILRGLSKDVRKLTESLISLKGVKHGQAVFTTEGKNLW